MIPLPDPGILFARVLIGFILLLMYSYNLMKAWDVWQAKRSWDTARQFIMSFELFFGITLIFIGYVNVAFFAYNTAVTDFLRWVGLLLLGVLLIGGLTLVLSWRKPKGMVN